MVPLGRIYQRDAYPTIWSCVLRSHPKMNVYIAHKWQIWHQPWYFIPLPLLHYTLLAQTWVLPFGWFIPHCCQLKRTHGSNSGSPAKCVYVLNAGGGGCLGLKKRGKKVITVSKYFFLILPHVTGLIARFRKIQEKWLVTLWELWVGSIDSNFQEAYGACVNQILDWAETDSLILDYPTY